MSEQAMHTPDTLRPTAASVTIPRPPARGWRYALFFLLWLLPFVVWAAVAYWQFIASQSASETVPGLLLLSYYANTNVSQAVIIWTLCVAVLWLYWLPNSGQPYRRTRVRYLLLWIVGLGVLMAWGQTLIDAVVPSAAAQLRDFTSVGPLLGIWTTLVFLMFIFLGDGSPAHKGSVGRYQGVLASVAMVLLATFLTGYQVYQGVSKRVDGLFAPRALAQQTLRQMHDLSTQTVDQVDSLRRDVDWYASYTPDQDLAQQSKQIAPLILFYDSTLLTLQSSVASATKNGLDAQAQVREAIEQEPSGGQLDQQRGATSITQIQSVIAGSVDATTALSATLAKITALTAALRHEPARIGELKAQTELLYQEALSAQDRAEVAYRTFSGVEVTRLETFLWIAVFYSIFVLFPWILLLLFLFRSRDDRVIQIIGDLSFLDPSGGLLQRALGPGAKVHPEPPASAVGATGSAEQPTKALGGAPGANANSQIVETLAARAFSNFEYILSLLLLSIITAVGWYYIFYPKNSLGLAELIQKRDGITELAKYLVSNISPLTLGFVGAYFFAMQMLVRRYLASDLYPSAFLQAAERLLRVFILSLVLNILIPFTGDQAMGSSALTTVAAVVAFAAGIFPTEGFRHVISLINQIGKTQYPATFEAAPLTNLDGVSIWSESRLLEEKVDNIESLATCAVEQLVLKTYYPTTQIVDWMDQAILYIHAGQNGEWFAPLRTVGIRTATDLLDAVDASILRPDGMYQPDVEANPAALERIVAAVCAANGNAAATIRDQLCDWNAELAPALAVLTSAADGLVPSPPPAPGTAADPAQPPADHDSAASALRQLRVSIDSMNAIAGRIADQASLVQLIDHLPSGMEQQRSLRDALGKVVATAGALQSALAPTSATAANLNETALSAEAIAQTQQQLRQVAAAAQDVRAALQGAVAATPNAIGVPELTTDILGQICDALWPDYNMQYIVNFQVQAGKRLVQPAAAG